jgi:hypothetical protein
VPSDSAHRRRALLRSILQWGARAGRHEKQGNDDDQEEDHQNRVGIAHGHLQMVQIPRERLQVRDSKNTPEGLYEKN